MKHLLFILLCFSLAGCATISQTKRLENQITELQGFLLRKDQDIKLKEGKLKEKELEVNRLRKELEKFGVFQ